MNRHSDRSSNTFLASRQLKTALFALMAALLASFVVLGFSPATAWATSCTLTDEMREQYEADGTLEERIAFFESLSMSDTDSGLIEQAIARQQASEGLSLLSTGVSQLGAKGIATVGDAKVLVLYVDFTDMTFEESDTADALQALFSGTSPAGYPYESLTAYYERSSYGKLSITAGDVYTYHATHERDYYTNNILALYEEALTALDS